MQQGSIAKLINSFFVPSQFSCNQHGIFCHSGRMTLGISVFRINRSGKSLHSLEGHFLHLLSSLFRFLCLSCHLFLQLFLQKIQFQNIFHTLLYDLVHERFGNKVSGPCKKALHLCGLVRISGQKNHGNILQFLLIFHVLQNLKPVHSGHMQIQQNKMGNILFQKFQCFLTAGGIGNIIILFQYPDCISDIQGIVIHDQNFSSIRHTCSHSKCYTCSHSKNAKNKHSTLHTMFILSCIMTIWNFFRKRQD